ncbi:Zn finger protein HypA/HybF involved in hydrogenase expression [Flavobacterium sp. 28YEA47A]|uniref:hypothetical protein n=1 Tax=Flavobacterium sp. 28YEA47A TaxID=3156276 RepID=UPI00351966AA
MKIQCPKCLPKEGIECPDFSTSEKDKLSEMVKNNPMKGMMYLREQHMLSLHDAKYIVLHINEKTGHCNRCNFDNLKGEYINCPKCRAFNFNWM